MNFKRFQGFQGCCGFSQRALRGCRPVSHPGTSCPLSPESVARQRKHAEHLGCDEAVVPCLQLLAGEGRHPARPGLGAFPRQRHGEVRGGLSRSARWPAMQSALGLRRWASGSPALPPEDCRCLASVSLELEYQNRWHACYLFSCLVSS